MDKLAIQIAYNSISMRIEIMSAKHVILAVLIVLEQLIMIALHVHKGILIIRMLINVSNVKEIVKSVHLLVNALVAKKSLLKLVFVKVKGIF